MATVQRVEELVFRAKTEGLDQAKAALGGLAGAAGAAGQATDTLARVTEEAGRAMRNPTAAFQDLQKKLEGSPRAWRELQSEMRKVSRAADEGKTDIAELNAVVETLNRNFVRAIAPDLSPTADLTQIKAMTAALGTFDVEGRRAIKRVADQMVEAEAAMKRQAEATADLAARTAKFRAALDPLSVAQAKLNEQMAEARALREAGAIGDDDVIRRTRQLNEEFNEQSRRLGVANDNLKLTSGQVQGLGYQINDVGTMLAMGASPFQVIASQAGQVVQVLQEGGGVKASLAAIGSASVSAFRTVVGAMGPVGLAFAGVTAAAGVFALAMRKDIPDANATLEKHEAILSEISSRYETLADRVKMFGQNAADTLGVQAGKIGRDLATVLAEQRKATERAFVGGNDYVGSSLFGTDDTSKVPALPTFEPIRAQVEAFRDTLRKGKPDVQAFRQALSEAYARAGNDEPMRKAIEAAFALTDGMAKTADAIRANQEALRALDPALQRFAERAKAFNTAMDGLRGLGPSTATVADQIAGAFDEASSSARTYGEIVGAANAANAATSEAARPAVEALADARDRLANLKMAPNDRAIAEIRQRSEAEIAELQRVNGTQEAIAAARAKRDVELQAASIEISRAETARREGYALDVKAIGDRTAAQKAETAAQRAYIDAIAAGETGATALQRASEAPTLSMGQANQALSEATRSQTEANERQIAQAQLEYDLVGKSAGEVARLRAEFDLLAQAKDAARSAGFDDATVTLTDEMKRQAATIGELTTATQRLNFERDLLFDRAQASRTPEEQEIAEKLRAIGVEYESAQGKADAAQLRLNNRLHETNDALQDIRDAGKDAFLDLVDAIGSGEDAIGGLMKAASGLFKQFSSAGFDRLSKLVFGDGSGSSSGGSGLSGILSAGASIVRTVVPTSSSPTSGFTAPIPTARPEYVAQAAAAVSGQVMSYAGRFNSSVDSRLLKILNTAASQFDMKVEAVSGLRAGDKRFHGQGVATDVQIYGTNGQALGNYQDASTFRTYERFAQIAKKVQSDLFPELEGMLRWGGYFSGGKGKYGAVDNMHFDLAGKKVGMGGGSWENGLTDAQRRLWAGAESVGMSKQDFQRVITRGTSEGVQTGLNDAARDASSGAASGQPGGARQLTGGQQALAGIGGIVGAFSGGYEAGSPLSGGLNGAMGGFELGSSLSFLGAAGGPIGAGIGAIAGILGGVLGGRAKRKAQHKEYAAQWDALKPEYEAWKKSLTGEGTGELRTMFEGLQANFDKFTEVGGKAWKYGSGNSIAEFTSTAKALYSKVEQALVDFRETFGAISDDLANGAGLDGPFAKGRASAKAIETQIKGFIDDVKVAFGSMDNGLTQGPGSAASDAEWADRRAEAVATAQKAATDYALSILDGGNAMSDVASTLQGLHGIAAGLSRVLMGLGNTAEDTAVMIDGALSAAIGKLKTDFVDSFQRQINDLSDVGYLNDFADLMKERETAMSDATLLGVDPEIVTRWYTLAAQSIVNGAELTGDAFADLVKAFPALDGVVKAFVETAEAAASSTAQVQESYKAFLNDRLTDAISARAEAESDLRSAYEDSASHLENFSKEVRDFLTGMRLNDNSPLSGKEQFLEVQKTFRDTLAKADAGDRAAQEDLVGAGQSYWDEAKAYYASSEEAFAVFSEVQSTLQASDDKATSQLALIKSQVGSLISINTNTLTIAEGISKLQAAIEKAGVAQKLADGGRSFGLNPERNRQIDAGLKQVGLNYTGNYGLTDGVDQFLAWRTSLPPEQLAVVNGIIGQYIGINRAGGGSVFGPGTSTSDSIPANLSDGEFVTRTWAVDKIGRANMDFMNRTGLVPDPYPQTDMRRQAANSSRDPGWASRDELAALGRKIDRVADILVGGFDGSIAATDRVGRAAEQGTAASRRAGAKSVPRDA